jgi:hypothetical protein
MKKYIRIEIINTIKTDKRNVTHKFIRKEYIKICVVCQKEFSVPKWRLNSSSTCSWTCKSNLQSIKLKNRVHSKEHNEKVSFAKRKGYFGSCNQCRKPIWIRPFEKKHAYHFCNKDCWVAFKRSNSNFSKEIAQKATKTKIQNGTIVKGPDYWNWKGGIYPIKLMIYGSKKMKEWRTIIFERNLYKCCLCFTRKDLRAHHIYYLSQLLQDAYTEYSKDYVRENFATMIELWDINNGITLCNTCHRKVHIDPNLLSTTKQFMGRTDTTNIILG